MFYYIIDYGFIRHTQSNYMFWILLKIILGVWLGFFQVPIKILSNYTKYFNRLQYI